MGSVRRWLRARLGLGAASELNAAINPINLVDEPAPAIPAPPLAGIGAFRPATPWSLARLGSLLHEARRMPTAASLQAARLARHCLSQFWLGAPVDALEDLYAGPIGALQRRQLEGPLPQQPLAADEVQWRDALVAAIADPQQRAQRLNLLLAVMPYFPPQRLAVADALQILPRWLLRDYVVYCEPELKHALEGPAALLQPADDRTSVTPAPLAASLEPLTERRGEEAMAWFRDEEALSRLQALVNLYALDPEDGATCEELAVVRRVVAQLWLDVEPEQLEALYATSVGLVTRSLITCGFGRELNTPLDVKARDMLTPRVGNLLQPGALNALLALLMFYPQGDIEVVDAAGMPAWLERELRTL
jgi:hypothetical protein